MKPLAGKRWFYSLGARSLSPLYTGPWPYSDWPQWAILAYFKGQDDARWSNVRQTVKAWPISKLVEEA